MSVFDGLFENFLEKGGGWIQIQDPKSNWTIEDFPYETGVDEEITKPHCWRCVTVNRCYFIDKEDKKPKEFANEEYSVTELPLQKRGLYHPNCHCKKINISKSNDNQIKFVIPPGKSDWMIKDKGHLLKAMGYKEKEFLKAIEIIKELVSEEFIRGNYNFKAHDEKGYRIGFVLNFPGKNEDYGKIYKLKTGWSIFPNGKLKCNTFIGGLEE